MHEHQVAGLDVVCRAARQDQDVGVAVGGCPGFPFQFGKRVACRPVPVLCEDQLKRIGGRALDTQVRVPPTGKLLASADVLVANVQTADKCQVTIDHDDLPVIAKVDLEAVEPALG